MVFADGTMQFLSFLFFLVTWIFGSCKNIFVITGSTGALGRELVKRSLQNYEDSVVYADYRSMHKMDQLLKEIKYENRVRPFVLDLEKFNETLQDLEASNLFRSGDKISLINNAGVFLAGNSFDALQRSLSINARSPLLLSQYFINSCKNSASSAELQIINISSGDGELSYLNSAISRVIESVSSSTCLLAVMNHIELNYDPKAELAFGDTPFYSVSKALLNTGTRVLHKEHFPPIRCISVCPGNVLSAMTTEEELETALDPAVAATVVLETAMNTNSFKSGHFFRNYNLINW